MADSSRKEKRQQAAAQREALRPLMKKIQQTEKAMREAEAELAQVQAQLGDSDLYNPERKTELGELLRREGELKTRAAELEDAWLEQHHHPSAFVRSLRGRLDRQRHELREQKRHLVTSESE